MAGERDESALADDQQRQQGSANPLPAEEEERRCRVCFEEDEEDGNAFISPCSCQGSQKYVHEKCLGQWQRSVQMYRPNHPDQDAAEQRHLICNVCRQPFSVSPPSRLTLLEELSGLSSSQIRKGTLLVATGRQSIPLSQSMPAHWRALFEARQAHWIRSVYLICSISGEPQNPAAGDQVIGVNLTRQVQLSGVNADIRTEATGALEAARRGVSEAHKRDRPSLSATFLIGGPVAPNLGHAVACVTEEGGEVAEDYGLTLVRACGGGEALVFGRTRQVIQCCSEYGTVNGGDGGKEGGSAGGRAGGPEGEGEGSGMVSTGMGGEGAGKCREGGVPGLGGGGRGERLRVWVYQGHARWSRQQLMGEVTRGSWGLLDVGDVALPPPIGRPKKEVDTDTDRRRGTRAERDGGAVGHAGGGGAGGSADEEKAFCFWDLAVASNKVRYSQPNRMKEEFDDGRALILQQVYPKSYTPSQLLHHRPQAPTLMGVGVVGIVTDGPSDWVYSRPQTLNLKRD
jgi:hypothetical protein